MSSPLHDSPAGKVVVFGGSGFLGSHVADELTKRGYAVTIFDVRTSPYLLASQKMVVGDILDKSAVMAVCEGAMAVYNFAGEADIFEASENPERTAQLNIMGNLNALEAARVAGAKRFVFASSIYVYSDSGSFYRASKQSSEKFVELYYEKYRLPFTILRYGSLYGRRADTRNSIHQFILGALTEGKITYKGSGNERREYIHAEDAAHASVDILEKAYENVHLILTGTRSERVKDVITMIVEILRRKVETRFDTGDYEAHYNITPYVYKPSIGKKLVTNPSVDIGQGILDCIHEIDEKIRGQVDGIFLAGQAEGPPPLESW